VKERFTLLKNVFRGKNFVRFGIDATSFDLANSLEKILKSQKQIISK
jgi:hypothetical protein